MLFSKELNFYTKFHLPTHQCNVWTHAFYFYALFFYHQWSIDQAVKNRINNFTNISFSGTQSKFEWLTSNFIKLFCINIVKYHNVVTSKYSNIATLNYSQLCLYNQSSLYQIFNATSEFSWRVNMNMNLCNILGRLADLAKQFVQYVVLPRKNSHQCQYVVNVTSDQ